MDARDRMNELSTLETKESHSRHTHHVNHNSEKKLIFRIGPFLYGLNTVDNTSLGFFLVISNGTVINIPF